MPASSIEIKGLKEAFDKLDRATSREVLGRIILTGVTRLKGVVDTYPPATEANQPRGWNTVYSIKTRRPMNTWYQRGYGSKWVVKSGAVHGRQSSEFLGRKWTVSVRGGGTIGIVGNNVTYGRYVQDEEKQARFHGARGWKTIQQVTEEERDTIFRMAKREIDKALAG